MDLEPGRIGFMSTQRRENRWQRTSCTNSAGPSRIPGDGYSSLGWRASGNAASPPNARHGRAHAKVGTVPPGFPAWLATNSLQSDHRTSTVVKQIVRSSSPPSGAARRAASARPAIRRSSVLHIPSPSGFVRIHPTLPQFPAGRRRWTERYDGKGNLHLLNAA